MRKLVILFVILFILDISLYKYLDITILEKKPYIFIDNDKPLIFLTNDIELNKKEDFRFYNYFSILTFDSISYRYEFEDDLLAVYLYPDIKYSFKYRIIEPEVVTEIVYVEKEVEVEKTVLSNEDNEYVIKEDYFYVDNEYLFFDIDADFDYIRQTLSNNIHTSYQTNIDYAHLNLSQIGQYEVTYSCEKEKIKIIVEIG